MQWNFAKNTRFDSTKIYYSEVCEKPSQSGVSGMPNSATIVSA